MLIGNVHACIYNYTCTLAQVDVIIHDVYSVYKLSECMLYFSFPFSLQLLGLDGTYRFLVSVLWLVVVCM